MSECEPLRNAFHQQDLLFLVNLRELDFNDFFVAGLYGAADESGLNWEFAVAAINQNAELHAAGPSVVKKGVHGGPDCAAGVKNVVKEDNVFVHNVSAQRGSFFDHRASAHGGKIVAVERDIQCSYRHRGLFNLLDQSGQTGGQGRAAALDAHKHQVLYTVVFFHDLMGKANERPLNF